MFITISHPIADLRPFADSSRLAKPDWRDAPAWDEFVRFFGSRRYRLTGGSEIWAHEESYVDARSALRLDLGSIGTMALLGSPGYAHRRLFFDGYSVGRVDIAMRTKTSSSDAYVNADRLLGRNGGPGVLDEIATATGTLRHLSNGIQPVSASLLDLGAGLAQLFEEATNAAAPTQYLVEAGAPVVVVERMVRRLDESSFRPDQLVDTGIAAIFAVDRHSVPSRRLVLIQADRSADPRKLRSLRITVTRIVAERHALAALLRAVASARIVPVPGTAQFKELDRFLEQRLKLLKKTSLYGIPVNATLRAGFAISDGLSAASAVTVMERLLDLRADLKEQLQAQLEEFASFGDGGHSRLPAGPRTMVVNIREYTMERKTINIGANAVINAPVVMAETIENSFNAIAESSASTDLKDALGVLHVLVAELGDQPGVAEEDAVEAAERLEQMGKEATRAKPNKSILEGLGAAISTVADRVVDVGPKVAAAVAVVLGFF